MTKTWAIILAAGESKRMGSPKLLLPFGDMTVIEKVISNVKSSKVDNILVVLGENGDKIEDRIRTYGIKYCYNDYYKDGMLSSVRCGFRNIPAKYRAVLVFQGDQPLISPVSINVIIDSFSSSCKGIVIPVHDKKRGHPVMIGRKYHDEIEKLDPGTGLKGLAEKFPEDVFEIEVDDPGILKDMDTLDEYRELINQIH